MNSILELALIIDRTRYRKIYNGSIVLTIIFIIVLIILFTFKYQSYYITMGTMIDNKLELLVNINDIKYIKNNHKIIIDDIDYVYKIDRIDNKLYVDEKYNNYKYVYLNISNLTNVDNYVYKIKVSKEHKALVRYLKDYL